MAPPLRGSRVTKLTNVRVLRDHKIVRDDLWFQDGVIVDARARFWHAARLKEYAADEIIDCDGLIVAPGYIDVQLNGGFGVDFSTPSDALTEGLRMVARKLPQYGVTAFCPTVVTSAPDTYRVVLPTLRPQAYAGGPDSEAEAAEAGRPTSRTTAVASGAVAVSAASAASAGKTGASVPTATDGDDHAAGDATLAAARATSGPALPSTGDWQAAAGARNLGIHLEGPFISNIKYGAHLKDLVHAPRDCGATPDAVLEHMFGSLDGVAMVTVAPELPGALDLIRKLTQRGVVVSLGHSTATFAEAEAGVRAGARGVTHLFNAMGSFHHRDPGLIGLLGSDRARVAYGIIADGVHSHPASVKIAYHAHPAGAVLVTDSISAMGLAPGRYSLGAMQVDIGADGGQLRARVVGTDTLAGSVAVMSRCVQNFRSFTGCSLAEALEAASLRPAELLGRAPQLGTLSVGALADLVLVDDQLNLKATFVGGRCVYTAPGFVLNAVPGSQGSPMLRERPLSRCSATEHS